MVPLLIDSANAPIFGFNVHGMVTECITGASGRPDLNPKSTIHDPEFFNCKEHRPINTDEAVEHIAAVQDAIQQVKAYHKYRTCCYLRWLLCP